MTLSNLLSKLEKSQAYKDFEKENPGAFLCAAFLIMNIKQNGFENSLDFRDDKNIYTFKIPLDGDVTMQKEEIMPSRKPLEKIDEKELKKLKVDVEDIQSLVEKELEKNKITSKLDEIIAVLQIFDGKLAWNLTCICEGFTIISMQINAISGKILKFEKKNLLDFVSVKKPEKK